MEITRMGKSTKLEGVMPEVGTMALDFSLENLDNEKVSLKDLRGQIVLLSVFPDITTSVCDLQTRHFFEKASKYPTVKIVNISNNTKDQLEDWCATNDIETEMLSDTDLEFAKAYGLYIPEFNVLARSVFVIDRNGQLVYRELVPEMVDEPDYDAVFAAIEKL